MIDINANGVLNTAHAVMRGMMNRRHGILAMMCSIAGRKVYPDHTVQCGTKHLVQGVSESLKEYLTAYDVRVLVLSPFAIETKVRSGVRDGKTLADYNKNKNKVMTGNGIGAGIAADRIFNACNPPEMALLQDFCLTPTRQTRQ